MARFRIRYLVARPRKDGTMRYYWQPDEVLRAANWKMCRLSDDKGEAMRMAEEKNQHVDQWRANMIDNPVNEAPGSVDALIADYLGSRHYIKLGDATKKDYTRYLKVVSQWAGDQQAINITAKMVQDLYETLRDKKPRKAMYIVQVLRLLFAHGERQSLIPKNTNPATNPGLEYKAKKGTLWSAEAVKHFVKTADAMDYFSIGTAVMLNEWLGQRRGDIIKLALSSCRDGCIYIKQSKTGAEVELPIEEIPELIERIDQQLHRYRKNKISGTNLIQKPGGRPYTGHGFVSAFVRIREEAIKTMPAMKKLVFKDLRHTAVTRLGESGATPQQIAAITGHTLKTCTDILNTYNIHTAKMAREGFRLRRATQQKEEKS